MDAIEKIALELLCGECDLDPEDYCPGLRVNAEEALRAIIAALTPPEGYVLVPVEPTEEMLKVGYSWMMGRIVMRSLYDELLAARPEVS